MDNWNYFQLLEENCAKKTYEQFKPEIHLQNELLSLYGGLFNGRKNKDSRVNSDLEISLLILNNKIINSMYCNLGLLMNGYYTESFAISRNIHEAMFLSAYLIKNPSKVDRWLHGNQINHKGVMKELNMDLNRREIYGFMCDSTHPNIKGARVDLILNQDTAGSLPNSKHLNLKIGPLFNKNIARELFILQLMYTMESIENFYGFFNDCEWCSFDDDLKKKKTELRKSYLTLIKMNQEILQKKIDNR